ncbi:MAG: AAA family ATPase [Planctomycetota bacterium]
MLDQIIGQERAKRIMASAVRGERVHHAWIFSGPMGVGKHSAAIAFAAMLLDDTTAPDLMGELAPDPESRTQQLIRSGAHPDMHLIDKDLAAYSDDRAVRERKRMTIPKAVIDEHLLGPIALAASVKTDAMAGKVFIIDEAERLDRSVNNAPTQASMLKTLEEPPAGSVIILVTSSEDRLLPTIRSRCQRVVFTRLSDDEMEQWLSSTGLEVSGTEREWVLRYAEGSPGRAALAVETGLFAWEQQLAPMLAQADSGRFPVELGSTMQSLIDDWAKEKVKREPHESKEAANREAAGLLMSLLATRLRGRLRANADDAQAIGRTLVGIDAIRDAERHIASNVNLQFATERLASALSGA